MKDESDLVRSQYLLEQFLCEMLLKGIMSSSIHSKADPTLPPEVRDASAWYGSETRATRRLDRASF